MKVENKLARAFAAVAGQEQQLESTAGSILEIVRSVKALTVKTFDAMVKSAYEANGWNTRAGRPNGGEKRTPIPTTVKVYVSIVRAALRNKLKIAKYKSFTALRADLARKTTGRDHRGNGRAGGGILRLPAPVAESFVGVEIMKAEPNGALFHDLGVVYAKLPTDHQSMLGRQLARLLHKYLPLVKGLPKPALDETERKAA